METHTTRTVRFSITAAPVEGAEMVLAVRNGEWVKVQQIREVRTCTGNADLHGDTMSCTPLVREPIYYSGDDEKDCSDVNGAPC